MADIWQILQVLTDFLMEVEVEVNTDADAE